MRKIRKPSILWAVALFLGLSFTAGYAVADLAADKKKEPPPKESAGKAPGKTGDVCKVNADCDQSGRPQRCRESKCELAPVHPVT